MSQLPWREYDLAPSRVHLVESAEMLQTQVDILEARDARRFKDLPRLIISIIHRITGAKLLSEIELTRTFGFSYSDPVFSENCNQICRTINEQRQTLEKNFDNATEVAKGLKGIISFINEMLLNDHEGSPNFLQLDEFIYVVCGISRWLTGLQDPSADWSATLRMVNDLMNQLCECIRVAMQAAFERTYQDAHLAVQANYFFKQCELILGIIVSQQSILNMNSEQFQGVILNLSSLVIAMREMQTRWPKVSAKK
ncbi:hypothetical protein N7462_009532 [Penicillium macrosclerotiorum]|uniref:uncharacterized protein n=1 Tax=Penicillium macrosclerotiorum TaxID=303699 RepID=UPI0025498BA3|nr:uncharacterized protein N7462_009532 [Penicillium macrosclerotiorum]KAJ5674093.1 hypothetical protein N7462_009532 [Penicillium macrosclerotiorum]